MTVRFLDETAIDKIIDLYSLGFSDGWNKDMLLSGFNSRRLYAIGCFDDKLIGAITFSIAVSDADLEGIFVAPNFRKRGVATKLLNEAEKFLRKEIIQKFLLEVRAGNQTAINFYQKNGFSKISVRKKYYPDGEDALVFIKEYSY